MHQAWKPITEFLKASRFGDTSKIAKLLESNPELDVNTGRDMMGNTPLVLAVKNDHLEVPNQQDALLLLLYY